MTQIHSALAYYYDNKERSTVERELREADALAAKASDPVFRNELLGLKFG